jgi:hypothetical protein
MVVLQNIYVKTFIHILSKLNYVPFISTFCFSSKLPCHNNKQFTSLAIIKSFVDFG